MSNTKSELNPKYNLIESILSKSSYTSRDYQSIINGLIDLFKGDNRLTTSWDNPSESDPLFIMLHLLAAHIDILNYQIDYRITENYMSTALERASLVRIANSFGYKIPGYRPAEMEYKVKSFSQDPAPGNPTELKSFTQFTNNSDDAWVYTGEDIIVDIDTSIKLVQGIKRSIELTPGTIDPVTKTAILADAQIATLATNKVVQTTTSRLVDKDNSITIYKEVPNIYTYTNPDSDGIPENVYELNVDPYNMVYLKFASHVDIKDKTFILDYLIVDGAATIAAPIELVAQLSTGTIEVKPVEEAQLIPGQNPATTREIKEGFKYHIVDSRNLVTVQDYQKFILQNQPVSKRFEVYDRQSSTSAFYPNGIPSDAPGYAGVDIVVVYESEEQISDAVKEEIQKKKIKLLNVEFHLIDKLSPTALSLEVTAGTKENSELSGFMMSDGVVNLLVNYISSRPIGAKVTNTELTSLIMSSLYASEYPNGINISLGLGGGTLGTSILTPFDSYLELEKDSITII